MPCLPGKSQLVIELFSTIYNFQPDNSKLWATVISGERFKRVPMQWGWCSETRAHDDIIIIAVEQWRQQWCQSSCTLEWDHAWFPAPASPSPCHSLQANTHTLCWSGSETAVLPNQLTVQLSRKYTQTHSTSVTHGTCSCVGCWTCCLTTMVWPSCDLLPHDNGMTQLWPAASWQRYDPVGCQSGPKGLGYAS